MTQQEIEESLKNLTFPDDWITQGWSRHPNTRQWVELGASKGITIEPPPSEPELKIHDVAAKLNELEALVLVAAKQDCLLELQRGAM